MLVTGSLLIFAVVLGINSAASSPDTVVFADCDSLSITVNVTNANSEHEVLHIRDHSNDACKTDITDGEASLKITYPSCGLVAPQGMTPVDFVVVVAHSTTLVLQSDTLYHLRCSDDLFNGPATFTPAAIVHVSKPATPSDVVTETEKNSSPELHISKTDGTPAGGAVDIGRNLTITIMLKDNAHVMGMDPDGCVAKAPPLAAVPMTNGWCPLDDLKADFSGFTRSDSASNDTTLTATFSAFRLVGQTKDELTIQCTVKVCDSDADCPDESSTCDAKRRKRDMPIVKYESLHPAMIHQVSADISVRPILRRDDATAGKRQNKSSSALVMSMLVLVFPLIQHMQI